jgi:hypothetical protein
MKTFLTKLAALSLVLTLGLSSCTEEDPITGGGTNTVTNLSANAESSTAINVRWEGGTAGDTLIATANGVEIRQPVTTVQTIGTTNYRRATISGLTMGTNYVLTVRNDDGTSGSLTWSPAIHWPSETNQAQTVRVWGTGAPLPTQPSGLIIDANGITAVSVNDAARRDEIDIVVATNPDAQVPLSVLAPGVTGSGIPTVKNTKFGNQPFNVAGGLDNDFYTAPITTLFTNNVNAVDIDRRATTDAAFGTSVIIPFLTEDNHYGRIELVPQNGQAFGTFQEGSDIYEFVEIRVSYQTQTGVGYVGRGAVRGNGTKILAPAAKMKY